MNIKTPQIHALAPRNWVDYELLDSGDGAKLERFGKYVLIRPDKGILWRRSLAADVWKNADAEFVSTESGDGRWACKREMPERWRMRYRDLSFWARLTPFRHTGIFPEQASHWDWLSEKISAARQPVSVLNLFAYTGIASLAAASAGASVTHIDASKPTIAWARENAATAGLAERPIRWILDDAIKFARREGRRGKKYDGIIIDPPVFGRGPKGEVWRFSKSFPALLDACKTILSERPLFVVTTAYEVAESSLLLANLLADWLGSYGGNISAGELILQPKNGNRPLATSVYARWSREEAS
jgi:23S rRNA (cytosine1962-C5)-methyltransferase